MIEINKNIVDDIVKTTLKTQVIAALTEKKEEIFNQVIEKMLFNKCDEHGNTSEYSSRNTHRYIDVIAKKAVDDALKEALLAYVNENKKELVEKLKKRIIKTPGKFIDMMFRGMESSLEYAWNFKVSVSENDD